MSEQNIVDDEGNVVTVKFEDDMQELAYGKIVNLIEKRNSLVAQSNAALGNRDDLAETLTETSDDPEIVAAREARDEAVMLLHKLVTPMVNDMLENAEANTAGISESLKELEPKLRASVNFYKQIYGDEAAKFLPKRISQKGGATGGGSGRRIRGYEVSVTVDGETTDFDNLAGTAKYLGAETADLQEKFFEAAGNPKALKDAPDTVTFSVTFTDVDDEGNEEDNTANIVARRSVKQEKPAAEAVDAE